MKHLGFPHRIPPSCERLHPPGQRKLQRDDNWQYLLWEKMRLQRLGVFFAITLRYVMVATQIFFVFTIWGRFLILHYNIFLKGLKPPTRILLMVKNPAWTPVEVGSLSHDLQGFYTSQVVFYTQSQDISTILWVNFSPHPGCQWSSWRLALAPS